MPRYFIILSYSGTRYHGWQIQPNAITVQQVLEEKMSILLGQSIELTGAGRTDTGVHAPYYVAHFDINTQIIDIQTFIFKINCVLPFDIAVKQLFLVSNEAHARFDAISRTYQYVISLEKNPFVHGFAWYLNRQLNIDNMNKAAAILLEYTDFTSFSKLHSDNKTNNCKIMEAFWVKESNKLIFNIKADRFLRNMVRAIVGTLVDIGLGKNNVESIRQVITTKNRSAAGTSVPAEGLYLTSIEYLFSLT